MHTVFFLIEAHSLIYAHLPFLNPPWTLPRPKYQKKSDKTAFFGRNAWKTPFVDENRKEFHCVMSSVP